MQKVDNFLSVFVGGICVVIFGGQPVDIFQVSVYTQFAYESASALPASEETFLKMEKSMAKKRQSVNKFSSLCKCG